jgi:uncharacterized membrane protein YeaQ/YmgE (transglycosylase-associated protein family)
LIIQITRAHIQRREHVGVELTSAQRRLKRNIRGLALDVRHFATRSAEPHSVAMSNARETNRNLLHQPRRLFVRPRSLQHRLLLTKLNSFKSMRRGWLAGQIVRGTGFGIVGDLLIGIAGAFIGSWLLPQLGLYLGSGIISAVINATIGALLLLLVIRLVRGRGGWSWGGRRWGGNWGRRW